MITHPTDVQSENNTKVSGSIAESLVPDVTQSHISNKASASSHHVPQDRWSRDQHIKLVNVISDPGEDMLTRSMAAKLTAASASECLFADFLSEIEPKKVSEPHGFESSEFPGYVYKLDKALYGLKHAPKACCEKNPRVPERKSTSGSCQILGGKLVCWSAKKQQSVVMSSAEAEYVDAAGCCASILWMKSQPSDYDIHYKMVPIFYDNTSAIAISNNPVLHSRTKHIDIRYHFVRDHIFKGDIELHFIPTEYQLADIFTKPLDEPTFTRLKAELGMLNID
ncbi:hypothetical protein Tco_0352344 [Tanacetum coccineum]